MILTLKKFTVNKDNDYERMTSQVGKMKIFLENILSGKVPNESYTSETLLKYCRSLVEGQRSAEPGLNAGSWSVSPSPGEIADDDLMDYHIFPTVIALATLVLCSRKYPEVAEIPGLDDSLKKGFDFIMADKLEGVGFNAFFQQLEIVLILGSGGCPRYLKENPHTCPALAEKLMDLGRDYARRLENEETVLDFGGDYKRQFVLALNLLQDLAD